jgi:hypothetical protein
MECEVAFQPSALSGSGEFQLTAAELKESSGWAGRGGEATGNQTAVAQPVIGHFTELSQGLSTADFYQILSPNQATCTDYHNIFYLLALTIRNS